MAEKRMFAKTVVTSDDFLDLPHSARSLYFTLGVSADDDGFVNAPKAIMRQTGNTAKDLKALIDSRFLVQFQSGVVLIRHWYLHNTIKNDRYKPTSFTDEKQMVCLDEKKIYVENEHFTEPKRITRGTKTEPKWNQSGTELEPQYSRVESNVDKDNVAECNGTDGTNDGDDRLIQMYGELGKGVVYLSSNQIDSLIESIGFDAFNFYVSKLADFIIQKNANVRNHYATILKWHKEDNGGH